MLSISAVTFVVSVLLSLTQDQKVTQLTVAEHISDPSLIKSFSSRVSSSGISGIMKDAALIFDARLLSGIKSW